jgi:chromosomal replication initiator protein
MITDIQPPDLETRVAILQAKAKEEFMNVSDDVLYLLPPISKAISVNLKVLS